MTELLEKLSNDISTKIKNDFRFEVKIKNEFKYYINHICNEKEDLIKNHLQNIYDQASICSKRYKKINGMTVEYDSKNDQILITTDISET